jgi:hypothetical protein
MPQVDPTPLLIGNAVATRFPSLALEVVLRSTLPGGDPSEARIRALSRFEVSQTGWTLDVMFRVTDGQWADTRFLIRQRSDVHGGPQTWTRLPHKGNPQALPFTPWQFFPLCALRWMDYILPPTGSYAASFNPGAAPSDPAWAVPAPCSIVDLALAPGFWHPEPRLTRLWIENSNRPVEHRIEQHMWDGRVRVGLAEQWRQVAQDSPWVADRRVVVDPDLGMQTTVTVERADVTAIDPALFTSVHMAQGQW